MYYGSVRPLVKRRMMYLSIVNEFLVSVAISLIVLFTDYVPGQDSKYVAGWLLNGVVVFMIVINMIPVLAINIFNLWLVIKKYWKIYILYKFCPYFKR